MLETRCTKSDKGVQTGAMSMAPLIKRVFGGFEDKGGSVIIVGPTELVLDAVAFERAETGSVKVSDIE